MADSKKDATVGEAVTLYVKKPAPQRSGYKVSQWTKKRVQFERQTIESASGSVQGVLLTVHRNRPRKVSENKSDVGPSMAVGSLPRSPPLSSSLVATGSASPSEPAGSSLIQSYSSRFSLHTFLSPSNTLLYRCK